MEFDKESEKILDIIGRYVSSIYHIGSTAVPGLKAKPIIDIAIELFRFKDGFQCAEPLTNIRYKHRIIPELPDRHYFSKGDPRTHQIHMYRPKSRFLLEQLRFRDMLRADPELANEYQEIKERLLRTYGTNKLAYADAKTKFIESVVRAT